MFIFFLCAYGVCAKLAQTACMCKACTNSARLACVASRPGCGRWLCPQEWVVHACSILRRRQPSATTDDINILPKGHGPLLTTPPPGLCCHRHCCVDRFAVSVPQITRLWCRVCITLRAAGTSVSAGTASPCWRVWAMSPALRSIPTAPFTSPSPPTLRRRRPPRPSLTCARWCGRRSPRVPTPSHKACRARAQGVAH